MYNQRISPLKVTKGIINDGSDYFHAATTPDTNDNEFSDGRVYVYQSPKKKEISPYLSKKNIKHGNGAFGFL